MFSTKSYLELIAGLKIEFASRGESIGQLIENVNFPFVTLKKLYPHASDDNLVSTIYAHFLDLAYTHCPKRLEEMENLRTEELNASPLATST